MKLNKSILLLGFFFLTGYAITVEDVQKLNLRTFFAEWSQFLEQVLQAKEDPLSEENDAIYKAFIQQAQTLDIPKATDNNESITAMKKQVDLIKKRITDEKKFLNDWDQFCQMLLDMKEFPVSAENEQAYQSYIQRAKDLHFDKTFIDEMDTKMNEVREKLLAESVKNEPEKQSERLEELEKKIEEISGKLTEKGENK